MKIDPNKPAYTFSYEGEEVLQEVLSDISESAKELRDQLILRVAEMILGRKPVRDDIKDFTIIVQEYNPNTEWLAYKGEIKGKIEGGFDVLDGPVFQYRFTPANR